MLRALSALRIHQGEVSTLEVTLAVAVPYSVPEASKASVSVRCRSHVALSSPATTISRQVSSRNHLFLVSSLRVLKRIEDVDLW